MSLEIVSYLLGKKAGGGGGGNPNRTETLTGTAADVFSSMTGQEWNELCEAVENGGASVKVVLDASALGYTDPFTWRLTGYQISPIWFLDYQGLYVDTLTMTITHAGTANWCAVYDYDIGEYRNPVLNTATIYTNGSFVDIKEYGSYLPATATIYWHPMPSGS